MTFRDDPELRIVKLTLRVGEDVHTALMTQARVRHTSMNRLAIEILNNYLAAQEQREVERKLREEGERHERALVRLRGEVLEPAPPW